MSNRLGGAVRNVDRDGSHGRSLHGNGVGYLYGHLLVEAQNRTELLVEVNVCVAIGSLDTAVVCQLDLLARLTRLLGHHLLNGATLVVLDGKQGSRICGVVLDGNVENGIGRSGELRILGNEVGLARKAQKICLRTYDLRYYNAFGGAAVGTLAYNKLTLLADDILSALVIALGLDESLLAVHHACARHLAELHYICCFYFHSFDLLKG